MRVVSHPKTAHQADDGYLRTLLYQYSNECVHIAIEGTLNSIAAALAQYPVRECRIEDLATNDIYCLAEPSGVGAPYFRYDLGVCYSHPIDNLSPGQIAALLLESIIFRVARILEDFHRISPIESVYLSGGLSELSFLQQGLAQCLPMKVYRLQEKDASLQGAGLLASGMLPSGRKLVPIIITGDASRLIRKFQGWKSWFDELLAR
jgi:glycerol kinase